MENKKIMKDEVFEKIIWSVKEKDLPNSYSSELHLKLLQTKREIQSDITISKKIERILNNLRHSFLKPVGITVTASLLFLLIGSYFYIQGYKKGVNHSEIVQQVISSSMDMGKEGVLRINFSSVKEIEAVDFEVILPEGICLVKDSKVNCQEKNIQWIGSLFAGRNIIKLPIMATHEGVWEIHIRAKKGNAVKDIKRSISVQKA